MAYLYYVSKTWSKPLPEVYDPQDIADYFSRRPHVVALRLLEVVESNLDFFQYCWGLVLVLIKCHFTLNSVFLFFLLILWMLNVRKVVNFISAQCCRSSSWTRLTFKQWQAFNHVEVNYLKNHHLNPISVGHNFLFSPHPFQFEWLSERKSKDQFITALIIIRLLVVDTMSCIEL